MASIPPTHNRDAGSAPLLSAIARDAARLVSEPLAPGLYIVATPIGNLGDVTLRALSVLARADVVCCEDTRHSAKLLHHFSISATTRPFHDHNEDAERGRILADLDAGKRVALISDAGTPLISDPGFKLVRACRAAGHAVVAIPGPSAALAALSASGLPTDAFFFDGFLPTKPASRRARLAEIAAHEGTLVFFEAPQRAASALADMAEVLGSRDAAVMRELTKVHEEFLSAPLGELAQLAATRDWKGEIVIVVGPAVAPDVGDAEIEARLRDVLPNASVKDAAREAAAALGVPKARAYALALKIRDAG